MERTTRLEGGVTATALMSGHHKDGENHSEAHGTYMDLYDLYYVRGGLMAPDEDILTEMKQIFNEMFAWEKRIIQRSKYSLACLKCTERIDDPPEVEGLQVDDLGLSGGCVGARLEFGCLLEMSDDPADLRLDDESETSCFGTAETGYFDIEALFLDIEQVRIGSELEEEEEECEPEEPELLDGSSVEEEIYDLLGSSSNEDFKCAIADWFGIERENYALVWTDSYRKIVILNIPGHIISISKRMVVQWYLEESVSDMK